MADDKNPTTQNGNGNGNGAGDRPTWLPENFKTPEDFANSYKELETWKGERSKDLETLNAYKQWGDPATLESRLTNYIQQQVAEAKAAAAAGDRQGAKDANANAEDALAKLSSLDPNDAALLEKHLGSRLEKQMREQIEGYWKQAQGQIQGYDQRFDLLNKALEIKLSNPSLDLNQIWAEMAKLASGGPDALMKAAMNSILAPKQQEKALADGIAAERAKWDQEQANKRTEVLNGPTVLGETLKLRDKPHGADAIKREVLSKFLSEGKITPDQL